MNGLRETNEQSMIVAHKAGTAYWTRNKPYDANRAQIESLARSCGFHGEDTVAYVAGFFGQKNREEVR